VVSTHLKNISQIGNLPQVGGEIKKYLTPPPRQTMKIKHQNGRNLLKFKQTSLVSKYTPQKPHFQNL